MSRGRAYPILKRTSHIIISLGVKEGVKIEKKKTIIEKPTEVVVQKNVSEEKKETKTSTKTVNKKTTKDFITKPKKQNWAKRIFRRKSV
jgi:hypothetical protein